MNWMPILGRRMRIEPEYEALRAENAELKRRLQLASICAENVIERFVMECDCVNFTELADKMCGHIVKLHAEAPK